MAGIASLVLSNQGVKLANKTEFNGFKTDSTRDQTARSHLSWPPFRNQYFYLRVLQTFECSVRECLKRQVNKRFLSLETPFFSSFFCYLDVFLLRKERDTSSAIRQENKNTKNRSTALDFHYDCQLEVKRVGRATLRATDAGRPLADAFLFFTFRTRSRAFHARSHKKKRQSVHSVRNVQFFPERNGVSLREYRSMGNEESWPVQGTRC